MNLRKLVLISLAGIAAALLSGCVAASHTTNGKGHTVILGGLVEVKDGAFEAQPAATLALNTDTPAPGSKLSGNKISVLWGLFSYRDQ
jgi:hypothetical protein